MELTKEQIQFIEHFLDKRGLDYVDVKYEVLDHLVTDVENLMDNNMSFEEAFKTASLKWRNQLRLSSSYLLGFIYDRPKIVINKAKKECLFWALYNMVTAFILVALSFRFKSIVENTSKFLEFSLFVLAVLCSIAHLYMYFEMKRTKMKTTFLFLFEKQVLQSTFLVAINCLLIDFNTNSKVDIFTFLSAIVVFPLTIFGFKLYKKHIKTTKKFALWN